MSPLIATIVLSTLLAALGGPARAQEALRGKSVVVTWSEECMQRRQGEGDYRRAVREGKFSAYFGNTGRILSRLDMMNPRRGGGEGPVRAGSGARRQIALSGRIMTAVYVARAGGARRIVITFDDSLGRCTAEVIRGKEEGAQAIIAQSRNRPGVKVEIVSVKTSGVSCAVKDGNVVREE